MNVWIIIPVLLVAAFFVVSTLLQRRHPVREHAATDLSFSAEGTHASAGAPEEAWWKNLSCSQQQLLALQLAEKAMPVWEKFTALQVVSYRDVPHGPLVIVDSDLLQSAVAALSLHLRLHYPVSDALMINQYRKRFVGPVLALKDGTWLCSYPVKKIFLSVYFTLMSFVKQHPADPNENFLPEAISAALECITLAGLYSPEELALFLERYRYNLR